MFGNWSTHLVGAYELLEACGGIKMLPLSSRFETQIGILTWYAQSDFSFFFGWLPSCAANTCRQVGCHNQPPVQGRLRVLLRLL